jgi:hypothetical protein
MSFLSSLPGSHREILALGTCLGPFPNLLGRIDSSRVSAPGLFVAEC